jgi:hypothetical protein
MADPNKDQEDPKKKEGDKKGDNVGKDQIDPKIAELMKDPDAVQALLEQKRAANAEAKKYREKLEEIENAKQKTQEEALKEQGKFKELAEAAKAEKEEAEKKFKATLIQMALQNEAIRQGIVDLDGVKLADTSQIKVDKDWNIEGAKEAIEALKQSKPYLFEKKEGAPPPPADKPGFRKNLTGGGEDLTPEQRLERAFEKKK